MNSTRPYSCPPKRLSFSFLREKWKSGLEIRHDSAPR
jgi:hypothetical protein